MLFASMTYAPPPPSVVGPEKSSRPPRCWSSSHCRCAAVLSFNSDSLPFTLRVKTRYHMALARDRDALDAVSLQRLRDEAGRFGVGDELAQVFQSFGASFWNSDGLADRHEAPVEHSRAGELRRVRDERLLHAGERFHFSVDEQGEGFRRRGRLYRLRVLQAPAQV